MVNEVNGRPAKRYTVYEIAESALQHFGIKGTYAGRMRGRLMYNTRSGMVLVGEYSGSRERFAARAVVRDKLAAEGINVSCYMKDENASYFYENEDSALYTVCSFCAMEECDEKKLEEVCTAIKALAGLHKAFEGLDMSELGLTGEEFQIARSLIKEYDKHNKELKMIKNYLAGRKTKTDFELLAYRECPGFLSEGVEALDRLKGSDYESGLADAVKNNRLCHGDFNYHNIYTNGEEYLIAGFSQMRKDLYIVDLYNFMRKLMEKYDWDIKMGYLMLREYDSVNTLSAQDVRVLGAMFSYPEKFWKILNYYFNANKAWIPNKNMEKLKLAVRQNRMRREFVRTLYGS